jgi:hypothetical protein
MTKSDVRYTTSKDGDAVYAILMGWPGTQVTLASVTSSRFAFGSGKVFLFGPDGNGQGATVLTATQDASGLHVTLPSAAPYQAVAYALKISKTGTAPAATPWTGPLEAPDGGVAGADGGAGPDVGTAGTDGGSGTGGKGGTGGTTATGMGGSGGSNSMGGRTAAGGTSITGGTSAVGGMAGTSASTVRGGSTTAATTTSAAAGSSANPGGSGGGSISSSGGVASTSSPSPGGSQGGTTGQLSSGRSTAASGSSGCTCSLRGHAPNAGAPVLVLGLAVARLIRRRRG